MQKDFEPILIANILTALATHAWLKTYDPVPLRIAVTALLTIPLIATYVVNTIIPSSLFSLTLAYPSFYLALTASVCTYRLSPFHPLAKYPGPVITKITKFWGAWAAYYGKSHIYVKELHDRYGPIVRTGPNELSITEKELIPQILGNQGMPKGPQWDGRSFGAGDLKGFDTLIAIRDTAIHAEMRAPWNKAFTAEPMKTYEELLVPRIIELNDRLRKVCSKGTAQVDIAKWLSCFTYDFMGDWVFSNDFRSMENGDKDGRIEIMDKAMYFVSVTQHLPWISLFARSLPIINRWVVKFVHGGVEDSLRRSQKELKRKDLFYYIGEASGSSGSDFAIIVKGCLLATVAAADTTASVLCNTIYSLLLNPEKYKKLQQEVDQVFSEHEMDTVTQFTASDGAGDKMYGEVLGSLKYMNAVINEAMRLFPVVPTGLHRAPEKGTSSKILQTGSTFIMLPEGNAVNVPLYALHRDSRYFSPQPDAFIPERWLSSSDDTKYVTIRDAYIPFSMGPANCAGRSLALMEMRYTLAFLIRNFTMEFAPNYNPAHWLEGLRDQYTLQKGDLNIRMTLRGKE